MLKHLLLSVSSEDKPGVVEKLSSAIESCGGNWLESRLANLRGRFVGVIWVSLSTADADSLQAALQQLRDQGITVNIDDSDSSDTVSAKNLRQFSIIGPDRPGIVKEVSLALSAHGINLEELETNLSSAPYSGEPIFEASGVLSVAENTQLSELKNRLGDIADELGLDLSLDTE